MGEPCGRGERESGEDRGVSGDEADMLVAALIAYQSPEEKLKREMLRWGKEMSGRNAYQERIVSALEKMIDGPIPKRPNHTSFGSFFGAPTFSPASSQMDLNPHEAEAFPDIPNFEVLAYPPPRKELNDRIKALEAVKKDASALMQTISAFCDVAPRDALKVNWKAEEGKYHALNIKSAVRLEGVTPSTWQATELLAEATDAHLSDLKKLKDEYYPQKSKGGNYKDAAAYAIARELARFYAVNLGKRPTWVPDAYSGLESSPFAFALRQIFDILGLKRKTTKGPGQAACREIAKLNDDEINKMREPIRGILSNFGRFS